MPRPGPDPAKIDHAARLYASGKSFAQAAAEVGLNSEQVRLALRKRGIKARPRGGRPAYNRIDPPEGVVDAYLSGTSEKALADRHGVSRTVVSRWLREAGVPRRTPGEASRLHVATLTPQRRAEITAAARAARRGRTNTEEHQAKIALARERAQYGGRPSSGTELLCQWLTERGIGHIREKAVGRYNVDIALAADPIAVEVLGGNWHAAKPIHATRTPYILDRGWHIVFVWNTKRVKIEPAALEYVLAFAEETRLNPPALGQYRVIRGDGQLVTAGQADDDEFPLVPPSEAKLR